MSYQLLHGHFEGGQNRSHQLHLTGAIGSNGTELLKLLSARGVPARAMVRSADKAGAVAKLPGVEIVAGTSTTTPRLTTCCTGSSGRSC